LISNFRRVLNVVCFLFGDSPASEFYMPTFRNIMSVQTEWNRQSVPKRRHIKFRRQGLTQKKAYNKYTYIYSVSLFFSLSHTNTHTHTRSWCRNQIHNHDNRLKVKKCLERKYQETPLDALLDYLIQPTQVGKMY